MVVKYYKILVMSKKADEPKKYLRVSEASKLLGVHANTLRNWDKQGILKPVRVGIRSDGKGERRYRREDVLKFLEESK